MRRTISDLKCRDSSAQFCTVQDHQYSLINLSCFVQNLGCVDGNRVLEDRVIRKEPDIWIEYPKLCREKISLQHKLYDERVLTMS